MAPMKTPKDWFEVPKDREAHYAVVAEANMRRGEQLHQAGQKDAAASIVAMIDGGRCVKCGREYKPVHVDNIFAKYTYYMPSCKCFPTCWHCRKVLIEEKLARDDLQYCPNCGVNIYGPRHLIP